MFRVLFINSLNLFVTGVYILSDSFICPYSNLPIPEGRHCEVGSCSFNLEDVSISKTYKRCFLNYVKATGHNPHQIDDLEQVEYNFLPPEYKEQIALMFLGLKDGQEAKHAFYIAIFSIMANDTTASLAKKKLDPVPYRQCCACGQPTEDLWTPSSGILPSGWGYCSWGCWQMLPPPIIYLMRILDVDFEELIRNIPYPQGQKSRLVFINHLAQWVLGETDFC